MSYCKLCDDTGRVYNNADPTSGMFAICDCEQGTRFIADQYNHAVKRIKEIHEKTKSTRTQIQIPRQRSDGAIAGKT